MRTKFRTASLRDVGMEAIESVQFNALRLSGGDDGISVSLSLVGGGSASISTDKKVLLRVLAHLLENAVREVGVGGHVTLQITSSGSSGPGGKVVVFEIVDDGKGLPAGTCLDQGSDLAGLKPVPSHRYAIGRNLRGLDSNDPESLKRVRIEMEEGLKDLKQNGVGVGLPLSYHLVRELGGDLRHDSGHEKGTRIWFALPIARESDMDVVIGGSPLETETISKAGKPPASITISLEQANKRRRIDDATFATFSSDGSTTSGDESAGDNTAESPATPSAATATTATEPPPEAVAKCGVKASMPFSVLIVEDTDICECTCWL